MLSCSHGPVSSKLHAIIRGSQKSWADAKRGLLHCDSMMGAQLVTCMDAHLLQPWNMALTRWSDTRPPHCPILSAEPCISKMSLQRRYSTQMASHPY